MELFLNGKISHLQKGSLLIPCIAGQKNCNITVHCSSSQSSLVTLPVEDHDFVMTGPRATTIPAESQSLPSNVHSWLHGLPVDEEQLGGSHLDPQALSRSVLSVTFKPLAHLCV